LRPIQCFGGLLEKSEKKNRSKHGWEKDPQDNVTVARKKFFDTYDTLAVQECRKTSSPKTY